MKALQIIPFLYLFIACLFIFDAIHKITEGVPFSDYWTSFLVAGIAVFMFFFRRKYSKRMVDHYKKK
ncbi:hypothetical protein [Myroides sp. WP-1]|uniref:hypothetical protein n=1 Tax=Myroides sp. WP-1 TaxID=2759944 RepID=UPI0015F7C737|nr:hypothetical protein [Myroides sp. WP-1]MBB1138391.1 hypothetical protein [Myroides sp. WP-1]